MKQDVSKGANNQPQDSKSFPELIHFYIRGNYRQDVFFDTVDFICAWNRLWLSAKATGVEILAAQILSNHLHLCLRVHRKESPESWTRPGGPALSKFSHHLRMSLSLYFNYRYDVHGSLGARRYGKGRVISVDEDGGDDLRDLIRYILRNVTHHKITDDYGNWPYSSYRLVYGLNGNDKIYRGKDIPTNLLKAYLPSTYVLSDDLAMTADGLIVPSDDIFPKGDIEKLFISKAYYMKMCATCARREGSIEGEKNERMLEYEPRKAVSDQEIIDYIAEHSLVPIASMNKAQIKLAIKEIIRVWPKVNLRQLSRIFHAPVSSIHYWTSK